MCFGFHMSYSAGPNLKQTAGTLPIIVCVGYRDDLVIQNIMLNTIIAHSESMQLIM
jgi:hypothetical protein